MSKKSKQEERDAEVERELNAAGANITRDPEPPDDLEERLDTDPLPPNDSTDSPRPDGSAHGPVFVPLPNEVGEPLPPRAPIPRGPFVRYHETEERTLHAVVTAVHEDGSVNLHVFPDGPRVNYLQNVAHGFDAGCWEDYL